MNSDQRELTAKRKLAGQHGGLATVRKHGGDYMAKIDRRSAEVLHTCYRLTPYGIGDFALVHKQTGQIKALLSGIKP